MSNNWRPYEPCNEPTEPTERPDELCALCGHPRVPHNYRHIFQAWDPSHPQSANTKYAQQRMLSAEGRSCKVHRDCRAADEMIRAAGGRQVTIGDKVFWIMTDHHE